jgi:hypothetical protein
MLSTFLLEKHFTISHNDSLSAESQADLLLAV